MDLPYRVRVQDMGNQSYAMAEQRETHASSYKSPGSITVMTANWLSVNRESQEYSSSAKRFGEHKHLEQDRPQASELWITPGSCISRCEDAFVYRLEVVATFVDIVF